MTLTFKDETGANVEDTWSFTTIDQIVLPDGHVHYDFNSMSPPKGSLLLDTTSIEEFEGVDDSGYLMLTDALNSQVGCWVIGSPLGKQEIFGFIVNFKVRIGGPGVDLGGTDSPADGLSFNFADNIPPSTWQGAEGIGAGLRVCIDTWDNGGGEAPAIEIKFGDQVGRLLGCANGVRFLCALTIRVRGAHRRCQRGARNRRSSHRHDHCSAPEWAVRARGCYWILGFQ